MTYVAAPLVRDPSFTTSSARRSHKSDTDSSKMSTQSPQEPLKPESATSGVDTRVKSCIDTRPQNKRRLLKGKEAKRRPQPGRPGRTRDSDYTARHQRDASASLFHHFFYLLFHPPPLSITHFCYLLFPLSLSLPPLSAWLSGSSKASERERERAPRSLQLQTRRLPIYIPMCYPYWPSRVRSNQKQIRKQETRAEPA